MKNSLKKLRGMSKQSNKNNNNNNNNNNKVEHNGRDHGRRSLSQMEEISEACEDMKDMRDCYDSLLSAAAAAANSAYEFSGSLRELGACLLEKTALNDDEDSGHVLLMLGKLQFQLQHLIDNYRSHIFQTITVPSESLLNELQIVEEMKLHCDEKRDTYEYKRQREKVRGRNGKGESFSMQQIQAAHDEFDEEATLFVFRLKSLKQGQSRSLLTQAARHHAAQLCFFRKALKSLEAVEPHVKSVTEQQHIDYHFSELEDGDRVVDDDDDDDDDDDQTSTDTHDDGELSFEYGPKGQELDRSMSRNSMELDTVDITFPRVAQLEENMDQSYRKSFLFRGELRAGTQSAPLFTAKKSDATAKVKQLLPSTTRKFNTYVLPTPVDSKSPSPIGSGNPVLTPRNISHSSPLDPKHYEMLVGNKEKPRPAVLYPHSVLNESKNSSNIASIGLPPRLSDSLAASDFKKIKRHAFSGPIARKPVAASTELPPQLFSGPLAQQPATSPKVSPSASPTFMSSPKISELHELPKPPSNSRPSGLIGYSAPLPKGLMISTSKPPVSKTAAAPLPTPLQVVTRSFSIPSSGLRAMALNVSKPMEVTHSSEIGSHIPSPPLTPIMLSNDRSSPTRRETVS